MKYLFFLMVFVVVGISVNAQQAYKYVIIPTRFSDFGDDLNPFGLSSSLQAQLAERSIKGVFEKADLPEDYCEALTVHLNKVSSVLTNKLVVEFRDCMNRVVWSEEGAGSSKEYREGYAEAIADAFKALKELPVNKTIDKVDKPKAVVKTEKTISKLVAPRSEGDVEKDSYKPVNPYYNNTYLVDVIEKGDDVKQILILNGELLGYKSHQTIATLSPSGLKDVYTVNWVNSEGENIAGVAKLDETTLEISLKNGAEEMVIVLQKL